MSLNQKTAEMAAADCYGRSFQGQKAGREFSKKGGKPKAVNFRFGLDFGSKRDIKLFNQTVKLSPLNAKDFCSGDFAASRIRKCF